MPMTSKQKLINKILNQSSISYDEAEKILFTLGFELNIRGSHHIFRKMGFEKNISLKKRSELLPYQVKLLKEVLIEHGYK